MTRTPWRLIPATSDRPGLRSLLLLLVLALTVAAYWWHFERRMDGLRTAQTQDAAQALSPQDRDALTTLQTMYRTGLGMPVLVRVEREHLLVPVLEASTLFVGVGLDRREAVVILPPLARRALGEGVRLEAEEALSRCLRTDVNAPGPCLRQCLETLWRHLHN